MLQQRIGGQFYFLMALAILGAILSAAHPAPPGDLAGFLLLTSAPEAALAAGAIGEDPDAIPPECCTAVHNHQCCTAVHNHECCTAVHNHLMARLPPG